VRFARPSQQTDDLYDLVVVGGGISGLATAFLYQQRVGPGARILILDNHDDFGGHAKRNEFDVDGERLIGYGGSQSIDSPGRYSPAAKQLLRDVAIDTERFYEYYDQEYFEKRKLGGGVWFSKDVFGSNVLANSAWPSYFSTPDPATIEAAIASYPISDESKSTLSRLLQSEKDYLLDLSEGEKVEYLRKISYRNFLLKDAGVTEEVADILNDTVRGYWGVGWDALSALEGYMLSQPGTWYLGLDGIGKDFADREEPYIFHYPDGNAGIARSIVRKLIPEAAPGRTMEDLVTTPVDYSFLDVDSSNVRIRLNCTCVDVRHTANQKEVDVTYFQGGGPHLVRARHAVLACYNSMIPHICSEASEEQIEAINYAVKVPLVYINIAIRNWQAFANLGIHDVYIPRPELMHSFGMDFPVSIGDYEYTQNPDQATVLHGTFVPTRPNQRLTAREQHAVGQHTLLEMSFEQFERGIVRQLDGSLAGGGFDVERDVAAITVNRWPHGYAYEYNELFDPVDWNPKNGPHIAGRAQIGRISIANSDASAYAYASGAIDAADRAVNEQIR